MKINALLSAALLLTAPIVGVADPAPKTTAPALAPAVPKADVKPFQPAVVISGKARERGKAYGKQFSAGIHEFLETQIYKPFINETTTKEDMLAYAVDCGAEMRKYCPVVAEEVAGMAEGAGVDVSEIVLIHLHEEFYHRTKLPKHGHCTVAAVAPSECEEKHAYIGQTWDWMTSMAGKAQATEWRRGSDGPDLLAYGFPGMPVGAGLNSRGIAFGWTSAALSNKSQSPRVGVPSYVLISHLLNQPDIESVEREAKRIPNAGWFTFVFNDAEGHIVNIEGSPAGVAVQRSGDRMVRADYGTAEKRAEMSTMLPTWKPPGRCGVLEGLLKSTSGKNGLTTVQGYLQDPKYTIAVAGRPKNVSIDVMLFDCTARKAYLTRGPEYGIEWREFVFAKNALP